MNAADRAIAIGPHCQNDRVGDMEHPEAQKKWDTDRGRGDKDNRY